MFASRAIAIGALALLTLPIQAQTYPTKPIRIVVPFAAGGPADVYARVLGRNMQETLDSLYAERRFPVIG